ADRRGALRAVHGVYAHERVGARREGGRGQGGRRGRERGRVVGRPRGRLGAGLPRGRARGRARLRDAELPLRGSGAGARVGEGRGRRDRTEDGRESVMEAVFYVNGALVPREEAKVS